MQRPLLTTLVAALALAATPGVTRAQLADPNPSGVTWGHIHLNVTDIEEHTRIWVEHFGGRVVDFDLVRTISLPNTIIMLNGRTPSGPSTGSSIDHFGFSVPDLDAFLERWRADGLEVDSEFEGSSGRQAYLRLPDGVRVELEQIPGLDRPAVPYHVHLYTDGDPEALRDELTTRFGMSPRQRGLIPFTADVPGMNVSFSPSREARAPSQGRAVDHVGFEVDGLETFTQRLVEAGVTLDVPYRVLGDTGLAIAFFTDASGTRWELTEGLDRLARSASGSPER